MGSVPSEKSTDSETRSMERAHYERGRDDKDELVLVQEGRFSRTEGTGQVEMMKKHQACCLGCCWLTETQLECAMESVWNHTLVSGCFEESCTRSVESVEIRVLERTRCETGKGRGS